MSTIHAFPDETGVKKMFTMLFGEDLKVAPVDPLATDGGSDNMVAVYINDDGTPATACFCDLPFAAFSGAALSMIPRGGAESAAKNGDLTEMMLGNLHEIMNICSRLFMNNHSPHLKLGTIYDKAGKLPADARTMVDAATGRSDFRLSIPGYGDGHIAFIST